MDQLLTEDSRTPIEKLRRTQLQKICKDNDINFDPSGPATRLVQLIEGSGIDVMKTDLFQKVIVQDENRNSKEVIVPVIKEHATASKSIDYDSIIEARAKVQEKDDENTELKARLAKMEEMLAKMNVAPEKADSPKTLEEQYFDKFGKKPHHKMKPETIQAQIDGKS